MELLETIIVGGGQAGLSLSYYLHQAGREHVILEQAARPAFTWREQRWDSFTLVTPNWSFLLPGGEYRGGDPDGFMRRDEIVRRFEEYIQGNHLPVWFNHKVAAVEPLEQRGYVVHVRDGGSAGHAIRVRNVVIATGLYQRPLIPPFAADLPPGVAQLHSSAYRSPRSLPGGAVLVIGSAQSGGQIVEDLLQAGRRVYLSTGSAPHVPRRYRGRDIYDWANTIGFLDRTPDRLPSPAARLSANPMLSGTNGGHALNLNDFHRAGVTLLGRACGFSDGVMRFAPDLQENLSKADQGGRNLIGMIDGYIEKMRVDAPPEDYRLPDDARQAPDILTLDLKQAGINTVIWACGLRPDFSLVRLPVTDEMGLPLAPRGVTRFQGLYFLGMPWLYRQKSGLLLGVGEDAAYLAAHIASPS